MSNFNKRKRAERIPVKYLLPLSLLAAFVAMKVTGEIDWSWWWVIAPLWIPVLALFVVLAVYLAFRLIKH